MEKEMLASVLREVLNEKRAIDDETHREHHEFIKAFIARQKQSEETKEKIKANVYGWGIIVALGGIGSAVYHWFIKGGH